MSFCSRCPVPVTCFTLVMCVREDTGTDPVPGEEEDDE